jgi:hypothetical protein
MSSVSRLPIPAELIHEIIRHLTVSSDCPSCLQADLSALAASSQVLNAIATPYLYSSITLSADHGEHHRYDRRLRVLLRTLKNTTFGRHVKNLQFSPWEEETGELWASITALTPNLETLYGVEHFFPSALIDALEPDECTELGAAAVTALTGLSYLRKAVLHDEVLTVPLERLLENWKKVEVLVLGAVIADGSRFPTLAAAISPSVRELYFHDFDVDYHDQRERDDALALLPPLEVLGISDTLGFTLSGVARLLRQSPLHAQRLHKLEFIRQLRRSSPLSSLAEVLAEGTSLKTVDIALKCYSSDPAEPFPTQLLASTSLEELSYRVMHSPQSAVTDAAAAREAAFEVWLLDSLKAGALPKLNKLTVGNEPRASVSSDELPPLWTRLKTECERQQGVMTMDPEQLGKDGKRVLLVVEEEMPAAVAANRVVEMKRGAERGAALCEPALAAAAEKEKWCGYESDDFWE